jgi:catechol 1,2-dioxygenase
MPASERLREIWSRAIPALRDVVTEMKITEDELHLAGRYLNRLGQAGMCPSLLDVMFAMTSIAATGERGAATRRNLEGPYYYANAPVREDGVLFEDAPPDAPILTLSGKITDARTGMVLPAAELDVWQANQNGVYDRKGFALRGIVRADDNGNYRLRTLVPDDYAEHDGDPIGELFRALGQTNHRAAHLHFKVRVDGVHRLVTQLFMPTSKCLQMDYVAGAVSDDLTLEFKDAPALPGHDVHYESRFDFRV